MKKIRIILIGCMGSGKTTLGKELATSLSIPFIDSDTEIEKQNSSTIPLLFETIGESGFRDLESKFIDELDENESFILSTGGGMPCFQNNLEKLQQIGTVFYLKNSSTTLSERLLRADNQRPLIEGKSKDELIDFIEKSISNREQFYNRAAVILFPEQQNAASILKMITDLNAKY